MLELRGECSRHNILKTTSQTLQDLVALGLKQYFPKIRHHGGNLHAGTHEIQICLLKTGLLFGMEIHLQEAVCGILEPTVSFSGEDKNDTGKWRVWTLPEENARNYLKRPVEEVEELALRPGETDADQFERTSLVNFYERAWTENGAIETCPMKDNHPGFPFLKHAKVYPFDSLLVAEGESSRLIRNLGFDRKLTRFANATGIVINIDFADESVGSPEKKLQEFNSNFYSAFERTAFSTFLESRVLFIENMEYLRGTNNHFIAMTTKVAALHKAGVVSTIRDSVKETLKADNIDFDRLRKIGRLCANCVGIPNDAPYSQKNGIQAFDFSCRGLCSSFFRWLEGHSGSPRALVLPIGDALQNPYWPQGLGVNMGFHGALDAIWASHVFNNSGFNKEETEKEINSSFALFCYVVYPTPNNILPGKRWTADPSTRYTSDIIRKLHLEYLQGKAKHPVSARTLEQVGISCTQNR